jgi:DNA-directed RNA polymerase sigma subunit (sigma70/sigma32)
MDLEAKINEEIDKLVDLKEEIRGVIEAVFDKDEQTVLRFRYIHNYTWEQIGDAMKADARTVRRWHDKALSHVVVPENAIKI